MATERERRDRPAALSRPPITAATRQMFQPLMATTWLNPVVVKLSVTSRATRSRRPTRMPEASPAIGSGSTRASAVSAASRIRSAIPNGSADASITRTDAMRLVAATWLRDEIGRELAAVLAHRLEAAIECDPVGRDEHRVARQPGVDPPRPASPVALVPARLDEQDGPLLAAVGRAQREHLRRPRPVLGRGGRRYTRRVPSGRRSPAEARCSRCRRAGPPAGCADAAPAGTAAGIPARLARAMGQRPGAGSGQRGQQGGTERTQGDPGAARHRACGCVRGQWPTVMSPVNFWYAASPTILRVRRSSVLVNGAL